MMYARCSLLVRFTLFNVWCCSLHYCVYLHICWRLTIALKQSSCRIISIVCQYIFTIHLLHWICLNGFLLFEFSIRMYPKPYHMWMNEWNDLPMSAISLCNRAYAMNFKTIASHQFHFNSTHTKTHAMESWENHNCSWTFWSLLIWCYQINYTINLHTPVSLGVSFFFCWVQTNKTFHFYYVRFFTLRYQNWANDTYNISTTTHNKKKKWSKCLCLYAVGSFEIFWSVNMQSLRFDCNKSFSTALAFRTLPHSTFRFYDTFSESYIDVNYCCYSTCALSIYLLTFIGISNFDTKNKLCFACIVQ